MSAGLDTSNSTATALLPILVDFRYDALGVLEVEIGHDHQPIIGCEGSSACCTHAAAAADYQCGKSFDPLNASSNLGAAGGSELQCLLSVRSCLAFRGTGSWVKPKGVSSHAIG